MFSTNITKHTKGFHGVRSADLFQRPKRNGIPVPEFVRSAKVMNGRCKHAFVIFWSFVV